MPTVRPRGVSEKIKYIFSPFPKISEEDLIKEAGLELIAPSKVPPFLVVWEYGGGFEKELVPLDSGDCVPLRESEAVEFMREYRNQGFVVLDDPNDPEEVLEKQIIGLRRAREYWRARGSTRIAFYRKARGLTKEEVDDMKSELHPWYLAEARVTVITNELRRLMDIREKRNKAAKPERDPTE